MRCSIGLDETHELPPPRGREHLISLLQCCSPSSSSHLYVQMCVKPSRHAGWSTKRLTTPHAFDVPERPVGVLGRMYFEFNAAWGCAVNRSISSVKASSMSMASWSTSSSFSSSARSPVVRISPTRTLPASSVFVFVFVFMLSLVVCVSGLCVR